MDAHALLTSQGWRGTGNSLHPTSNSIGLSKPLLVSKKQDTLGIGKKQHRTSDMWWMKAFDTSLKGLDTSKDGQVVQTVTSGGLDMVSKGDAKWVGSRGWLYASFVRGESLSGTITPNEEGDSPGSEEPKSKKRKLGDVEVERMESKEERRAREAEKRAKRAAEIIIEEESKKATAEDTEMADVRESGETKEERKARRAARKLLKLAAEAPITEDLIAIEEKPNPEPKESKAEKKERKRLKRLAQEEKTEIAEPKTKRKKEKNKKQK